jgi:hypothetical protein
MVRYVNMSTMTNNEGIIHIHYPRVIFPQVERRWVSVVLGLAEVPLVHLLSASVLPHTVVPRYA